MTVSELRHSTPSGVCQRSPHLCGSVLFQGCYSALNREMNKKSLILISVAGAIAAVQVRRTRYP